MSKELQTDIELEAKKIEEPLPDTVTSIQQSYSSPTLEILKRKKSSLLPTTNIACKSCPNAIWYIIEAEEQLICFCNLMHSHAWMSSEPVSITICDGQMQESDD